MIETLMICVTIAFCTLCITIYNVKKISANVYTKLVIEVPEIDDPSLPESPYSLVRSKSFCGSLGYSVAKNNEIITVYDTNNYEIFSSIENAVKYMNVLQKIDRVRLTKL